MSLCDTLANIPFSNRFPLCPFSLCSCLISTFFRDNVGPVLHNTSVYCCTVIVLNFVLRAYNNKHLLNYAFCITAARDYAIFSTDLLLRMLQLFLFTAFIRVEAHATKLHVLFTLCLILKKLGALYITLWIFHFWRLEIWEIMVANQNSLLRSGESPVFLHFLVSMRRKIVHYRWRSTRHSTLKIVSLCFEQFLPKVIVFH